ncbi:polyprenyl diphosphate synthase [Amaricoccus solimangrovi]|uniref:Isoprenyl transferase n=1 Tax=Amaricoccus solimangrovi TaxID=2589815 RepID=A0A501X035_9RHOB|nr:polyprenyl diphosphate synthase [Amaricoccus solimangrovi]TPE53557.1 di-trans,poly-cis-decaprenylcistransferase [Amaricoccus solimangrovi]
MKSDDRLNGGQAPAHVAIIMDGNGRWAESRGLPRLAGHRRGADRVREIVEACPDLGVSHLTLFAFSTENWKRPAHEVQGLMRLFRRYIKKEGARLVAEGARVRFIGGRDPLDADLRALMEGLEARTAPNQRLHLTVAINYGGRDEILRATRRLAEDARAGRIRPEEITQDTIGDYLDTAGLPDPDLIVRTSGEFRVSGFLPWQAAYSEYAFIDTRWPDFTAEMFASQIRGFGRRERRFGAVAG